MNHRQATQPSKNRGDLTTESSERHGRGPAEVIEPRQGDSRRNLGNLASPAGFVAPCDITPWQIAVQVGRITDRGDKQLKLGRADGNSKEE